MEGFLQGCSLSGSTWKVGRPEQGQQGLAVAVKLGWGDGEQAEAGWGSPPEEAEGGTWGDQKS